MSTVNLNLDSTTLVNRLVVEASAGTGKTYSIAGLVAHAIGSRDDLRISEILITTFTRNAAAELRDRVRRRIIEVADAVGSHDGSSAVPSDPVVSLLLGAGHDRASVVGRLRRAETEFDSATISTIHGVCNRILTLAGRSTIGLETGLNVDRLVLHAVNDALVADAVGPGRLAGVEQSRLEAAVKAALPVESSTLELHVSSSVDSSLAEAVIATVASCVERVRQQLNTTPSYDDLVRLAADILDGDAGDGIQQRFRDRFKLAFVDEAQDTDGQQWRLFHGGFPEADTERALIAVGDPKQAIYGFRGADVNAYLDVRDGAPVRTLTENQRSDQGLVRALNGFLGDAEFGEGIEYEEVSAAARHSKNRIIGTSPLELLDIGDVGNQMLLADIVSSRVVEILTTCRIDGEESDSTDRVVVPGDICVLVGATAVGRAVESRLRARGVPAVSNGTESVMQGELARAWRILLEALDRPGDLGRARRLAATPFLSISLLDPRLADDRFMAGVQDRLLEWAGVLRRSGVAALASRVVSDPDVVTAIADGSSGERYLADLSHIVDLLHEQSRGEGISVSHALDLTAGLDRVEARSELVSRRVESDSNAVQIMTIHSAKGLQFPIVVVADLWKVERSKKDLPVYRVDSATGVKRRLDLGWVLGPDYVDDESTRAVEANSFGERSRLLYVALTRAEHHVTLLHTSGTDKPSVIDRCASFDRVGELDGLVSTRRPGEIRVPKSLRITGDSVRPPLSVTTVVPSVRPEVARTSFSGITGRVSGRNPESTGFGAPGAGNDEEAPDVSSLLRRGHRYANDDVPVHSTITLEMPLARVPGGTHFGTVMHKVYEEVDPSAPDYFERLVESLGRWADSPSLRGLRDNLARGVQLSFATPLGGPFGNTTLADFGPGDRLSELDFEMAVAGLSVGVTAADIGRTLVDLIDPTDPLADYARELAGRSYEVPLGGILNGSIDAVLRLRGDGGGAGDRLFVTDYKTNRLDEDGDANLIDAYHPSRLVAAMEHHNYPLQALIYGTAAHRYLRWRRPDGDGPTVAGVAYFFVRGMVGPNTPGGADGRPCGVFHWSPPDGLWDALSDRLYGPSRVVTR